MSGPVVFWLYFMLVQAIPLIFGGSNVPSVVVTVYV